MKALASNSRRGIQLKPIASSVGSFRSIVRDFAFEIAKGRAGRAHGRALPSLTQRWRRDLTARM